jgi:hypothetical protein
MKKFWLCVLALGPITLVPTNTHAYAKCEAASACGYPCYAVAIYTYYDGEGNAYCVTGGCCGCT